MGYDPTVVRTVAQTFGFELTEAEAREIGESAARFEQAARAVTPPDEPSTTHASDVRPGTDEYNAFNYRCSLGDGEGPLDDLEVGVKDNIAVAGVPMT